MSGEPAKEVVIVIRCELEIPDDLERVMRQIQSLSGVTNTWGWVGLDDAAQAVLAVVDPVSSAAGVNPA
jgi:hypothetical protein